MLLDITIPGDPVSKGRPRSGRGRTYTPKRTREAEDVIRAAVQASRWATSEPYAGPVSIQVWFYCATRRRTDGDNLVKLVVDAIQRGKQAAGGVILDDAQIEEWYARVYRRLEGETPRTQIILTTLAVDAVPGEAGESPATMSR